MYSEINTDNMENCTVNILPRYNAFHNLVPDSNIILQTIWNTECISMSVYLNDMKKGFTGTISTSTLSKTASALEINLDEFMAETRSALCTENGSLKFTYYLEESKPTTFKWCKATGFRITYGSVVLEEKDNLLEEIIVKSIRINRLKDEKIAALNLDINRMDDSFNEMKVTLEKCVDEKVQLENELLKKFAALLNTKKAKIVELERAIKNQITDYESDGSGDDSDLDYSTQTYVSPKSPTPSASNQQPNNDVVFIPKRVKIQPAVETIVNVEQIQRSNSTDIYDRETELLMDDM